MLLGCGINVVFLLVILLAFFIYLKNEAIFKRNQLSVRDPFMKMIFSEEICLSMNVDFHYFRIDFKGKFYCNNFPFFWKISCNMKRRDGAYERDYFVNFLLKNSKKLNSSSIIGWIDNLFLFLAFLIEQIMIFNNNRHR